MWIWIKRLIARVWVAGINCFPRSAWLKVAELAGSGLYWLIERTRFRGAMQRTVRTAFPQMSQSEADHLARKHAQDFLKTVVEVARGRETRRLYEQGRIVVEGTEHLQRALAKGRGAVLLSAHMGNWEILISIMGLLGFSNHAVVARQTAPVFNEWLTSERERYGSKVIFSSEVKTAQIMEILAKGGVVMLLADHHHYNGRATNIVEFFGKPVSVPGGPVAYTSRSGAPLVPAFAVRTPGEGHRIVFQPEIELVEVKTNEDFLENCRRYIAVIEDWIKKYPDQWMWSHDRWEWLDENLRPKDTPFEAT